MNGMIFDALTRRFSRRGAIAASLAGAVGGGVAIASGREATAQDVSATALPSTCRYFAISGSRDYPTEDFNYDDDMTITLFKYRNGKTQKEVLLRDKDGLIGVNNKDVDPVVFRARIDDELKIVVRDRQARCYSLEALYLHCCTSERCVATLPGNSFRLTSGVKRTCASRKKWKKSTFFNETWTIR